MIHYLVPNFWEQTGLIFKKNKGQISDKTSQNLKKFKGQDFSQSYNVFYKKRVYRQKSKIFKYPANRGILGCGHMVMIRHIKAMRVVIFWSIIATGNHKDSRLH